MSTLFTSSPSLDSYMGRGTNQTEGTLSPCRFGSLQWPIFSAPPFLPLSTACTHLLASLQPMQSCRSASRHQYHSAAETGKGRISHATICALSGTRQVPPQPEIFARCEPAPVASFSPRNPCGCAFQPTLLYILVLFRNGPLMLIVFRVFHSRLPMTASTVSSQPDLRSCCPHFIAEDEQG
jgi:hypothetical protein